jgi:UDP-2,4-diacetamido-2,4,6-trideoxy-beta-L-altropyranose hydrolase
MDPGTLLIRADASVTIGTGHVMRCLALAQGWQDAGGEVVLVAAEMPAAIEKRLGSEGVGLVRIEGVPGSDVDGKELIALARTHGPSWVVVDGYQFGMAYQRTLKNERLKVLVIDDEGRCGPYVADIVLNQNLHAQECLYRNRETYTRLLLGTKYALLRREFVFACGDRKISTIGRRLLVSMGGSDPENVTRRVMEALDHVVIADLQVAVVIGGSNPHLASVAESVAKARHTCLIRNNVTNMRELISWADLAISAAGSACWEYCVLGLPAALVAVADNQIPNAEALNAAGAARLIDGGSWFPIDDMAQQITRLANSFSERQVLSQTARTLVDGLGASRVTAILMSDGTS